MKDCAKEYTKIVKYNFIEGKYLKTPSESGPVSFYMAIVWTKLYRPADNEYTYIASFSSLSWNFGCKWKGLLSVRVPISWQI